MELTEDELNRIKAQLQDRIANYKRITAKQNVGDYEIKAILASVVSDIKKSR